MWTGGAPAGGMPFRTETFDYSDKQVWQGRIYGGGGSSPLMGQASGYLSDLISGKGGQGYAGATNLFVDQNPNVQTTIDRSLTDTAGGKYLDSNPYIDAIVAQSLRPATDAVQSMFAKGGQLGSGMNQQLLASTLGDVSSRIRGENYARERQNQLSAGNAITGYSSADRARQLQAIEQMNQIYTNNANRQFQGLLFAPQFNNEASGWGPLQRYLASINGMNVGTSQSGSATTPYYSNPIGQGIGTAATAAQGAYYLGKSGLPEYLGDLFGAGGGFNPGNINVGSVADPFLNFGGGSFALT